LLTGGLFVIGWLVDLFLVPDLVRTANEESRLRGTLSDIPHGQPPRAMPVQDYVSPARQDQPIGSVAPGHRVLYCTHCGSAMQVPIQAVGHHFACPACHHVVIAPG
jgi:hypothetical protein